MKKSLFYGSSISLIALYVAFFGFNAFATDAIDEVIITVPASCGISGTNLLHTTSILVNQYKTDIGTANIKATCNDAAGFSIYAIGYSGEQYGNTKMLNPGLDESNAINTGKFVSGTTTDSVWSIKLTPVSGDYTPTIRNDETYDYTNYEIIPSTYTKVVSRSASTDSGTNATGSSFTIDYAVYASAAQAAGTYTGKVKFTLIHPENELAPTAPLAESACPANSICYAPNASDIIGSMSTISSNTIASSATAGVQSVSANGSPTLIAPNYSRNNYGFAGWSPDFTATNSSKIYGPNQVITTKTDGTGDANVSSHGLILYPVWVASDGYLQDWDGCGDLEATIYEDGVLSADLDSLTALTDRRDGNTYAVARLSDGNCWIIENFRLGSISAELMSAYSQGIGGVFTTLADSENSNIGNTTTANSLYNTGNATTMPRYNGNNSNRSLPAAYNSSTCNEQYCSWYGYGHYYTYAAAKANTTSFSNYASSTAADTSICPKGWILPKGSSAGEYYALFTSMSGNTSVQGNREARMFPNNFLFSGYFSNSFAGQQSGGGYYWTSSKMNSMSAYMVQLGGSTLTRGDGGYDPYNGRAIRCVYIYATE